MGGQLRVSAILVLAAAGWPASASAQLSGLERARRAVAHLRCMTETHGLTPLRAGILEAAELSSAQTGPLAEAMALNGTGVSAFDTGVFTAPASLLWSERLVGEVTETRATGRQGDGSALIWDWADPWGGPGLDELGYHTQVDPQRIGVHAALVLDALNRAADPAEGILLLDRAILTWSYVDPSLSDWPDPVRLHIDKRVDDGGYPVYARVVTALPSPNARSTIFDATGQLEEQSVPRIVLSTAPAGHSLFLTGEWRARFINSLGRGPILKATAHQRPGRLFPRATLTYEVQRVPADELPTP